MAASEVRRAIVGRIPDTLRNCVNKVGERGGIDQVFIHIFIGLIDGVGLFICKISFIIIGIMSCIYMIIILIFMLGRNTSPAAAPTPRA